MASLSLLRRSSRRLALPPSSSLPLSSPPLLLLPSSSSSSLTAPVSNLFSALTVRWASIAPYALADSTCFSPPPPPMSAEQLQQIQHQKQESRLEDQIRLEQSQRIRQQTELQLQLSRHRNAILEQQSKQQQLYEQDLQERRRRQLLLQQKQSKENEDKEEQPLNKAAFASTTTAATAAADPSPSSPRQENEQEMMQEPVATSASEEEEESTKFVATRHRPIFGYRGPEHLQNAEAVHEDEQELGLGKDEQHSWSMTLPASPLSSLLSAEIRVQLAMMDYTPKRIDAMTLAEAQAILKSTTSNTSTEATLSASRMEESLSPATSAGVVPVSPSSVDESLSPVMEYPPTDRESGRYIQ